MATFISNPIAFGVRTDATDQIGGPLANEIIAGSNINIEVIEPTAGDRKLRVNSTSTAAGTYIALTAPTVLDDGFGTSPTGKTFAVNNYWLNMATNRLYRCDDATQGNAVWTIVDATVYKQVSVPSNSFTNIDLGAIATLLGMFIDYRLYNAILGGARVGRIYIGHDGTSADLRDEYVTIGTVLTVTPTAVINGASHLILKLTAGAGGSTNIFRYREDQLA